MQADKFTNGGDPGLDELLRQSFLDLDQTNPVNDELFDMASQNVFGREWPVQVDAKREAQFTNVSKSLKWPWYLGGIGAAGIIVTATLLLVNHNNKTVESNLKHIDEVTLTQAISPLTDKTSNNERQESNIASYEADANQIKKDGVDDLSGQLAVKPKLNKVSTANSGSSAQAIITDGNNSNRTIVNGNEGNNQVSTQTLAVNTGSENADNKVIKVPVLSAEQTEETKKDIQKLVFDFTTNLVYHYSQIPGANSLGYNNKAWHQSVHMKTTEVTVKEYSLFLNDLIMNGKHDEYEKARPKVEEMYGANLSAEDRKFFESYFNSAHYKNYPMVFITPEAAKMYCSWLEELVIKHSNGKFLQLEVRLPFENEWLRAASGGDHKNSEYATENGKLKKWTFRGTTYNANYKETQQKKFDFLSGGGEQTEEDKKNERDNTFTCHVRKYDPNGYGLYNMSGNVSEMVVDKQGKVMAKGGNWNSAKEYLIIKKEDLELFNEFPMGAQASPYIGFRPVISFK